MSERNDNIQNAQHGVKGGMSKEEMARKIAGNLSSYSADDVQYREDARRRAAVHTEFAGECAPVNNPYLNFSNERRQGSSSGRPAGGRSSKSGKSSKSDKSAGGREKNSSAKGGSKNARKKKKKKNKQRRVLSAVITLTVMLAAVGGGGAFWYTHGKAKYDGVFLDNTFINGTEVSRKTPKEAAELVKQDSDMPDVITLTRPDGSDVRIPLSDIGLKDNLQSSVDNFYKEQNHSQWFTAKSQKSEYSFKLDFSYDEKKLDKEINRKIVEGQASVEPEDAYIQRTGDGFEIVPEVVGNGIDEDKVQVLYDYIDGFLERGEYSINLSNCNCYDTPNVRSSDLKEQLNQLNSLYDTEFTFDFIYTTETLSGSQVIDWITFENDNPLDGYTVDKKKAMAYVEELAGKYDTYGKDRTFNSTSRGKMTIEQGEGDYGWWIDQKKTCNLLVDLIEDGVSVTTEPYYYTNPDSQYTYTCNPKVRTADDDIGDTYCEVDLKKQHFWYYKKGKLEYECDIVSGKPTPERNTPGGVYKLWYKELNKVLSGSTSAGETWSTPVTFWNNISTFGVGLHDATWHTSFGGSRYVNYGSHGCINMPYDAAKFVYDNVELNTPVIMYW